MERLSRFRFGCTRSNFLFDWSDFYYCKINWSGSLKK